MTKYRIENLKATKNLTPIDLFEYGFTNNIEDYYYYYKIISNYRCINGKYISESINITFKRYKTKNNHEKLKLDSIAFLCENELKEDLDYKSYFEGKMDYSMLSNYYQNGVKVAEGYLQDLIDKGILEFKEKQLEGGAI